MVIVGTLALGIGAATTMFSIVHGVLLAPLPYPSADHLVRVWERTPQGDPFSVSPPTYRDLQALDTFEDVGAVSEITEGLVLSGQGEPVRVRAAASTASLLRLLRAPMRLGRTFTADLDAPGAAEAEVVLSHELWMQRFGGREDAVGTSIQLDGVPFSVVGVLAPGVAFPEATELWVPLASRPAMTALPDRDDKWLSVVARLAPGQSMDQAADQLHALGRRLSAEYPHANEGWSFDITSLQTSLVSPPQRVVLWTLMGAVACLLLLACANVAGLLMIEAIRRDGEFRLRAALGASPGRVVRQLLVQSLLLAMSGAAIGVVCAWQAVHLVRLHAAGLVPGLERVSVDRLALLLSLGLATACCLLIGSAPGLRAATVDLHTGVDGTGRGGTHPARARLRRGLIVLEVGLALVLLSGAALMATSFARLSTVDAGFRHDNVLAVPLDSSTTRQGGGDTTLLGAMEARLASLPDVEAVGATSTNPWRQFGFSNTVTPMELAASAPRSGLLQAQWRAVTPGVFEALGIPLLRGEGFPPTILPDGPRVVVVTRGLAERLWPGADPIGKRVLWGGTVGEPRTVIGVVGDIRDVQLEAEPLPLLFVPHAQTPVPGMTLVVKARGDAAALEPMVRALLREIAPGLPVPDMSTLATSHAEATARPRLIAGALAAMAATGLVLAASGLYALLAFAVVQRRRELSIRLAVGSTPGQVTRLVLADGLRLTLLGIVLGVATALSLGEWVAGALHEVAPTDPVLLTIAAGVLLGASLAASYHPARAAAQVDPAGALRAE
jgi:predicted permease